MPRSNRQLFLSHLAQTSPAPLLLEVERAEGVWMYEPSGHRVLDMISGIGVSTVGHRHPDVVSAIKTQADRYLHLMVYGEVVQTAQTALAEALLGTLPNVPGYTTPDCFYFTNSGSEAVDGAIKLAKRATGRPDVVVCHHAYHGGTNGALSAGGGDYFKQGYHPLLPGMQRGIFGSTQLLDLICDQTAAVLVETMQGEAGIRTACKSWWQALRQRCHETGTLLILDEIQSGVGRTGKWWGFEHYGIMPDMLLSAKGIGGGMPIGFFAAHHSLMSVFADTPVLGHITTFGGHPVSCAAALATIHLLESQPWMDEVPHKAAYIRERLGHLPYVTEIRGIGLLMALELGSYARVRFVIDYALQRNGDRLLTDWFLYCDTAIRVAPPISISQDELRIACDILTIGIMEAAKADLTADLTPL